MFEGPRAAVVGIVTDVQKAADGDVHIDVTDSTGTIVCETIPEMSLPVPNKEDKIQIWGITRYDIAHRWWELHPVLGWRKM